MEADQRASESVQEARELELIKAAAAFEHTTLKMPDYLNDGALLASLTILGHLWSLPQIDCSQRDRNCLVLWVFGLSLAGMATHFGYLSQHNFLKSFRRSGPGPNRRGDGEAERILTRLDRLPELLVDDAQLGKFGVLPKLRRIGASLAPAGAEILDIADPVPDQPANR